MPVRRKIEVLLEQCLVDPCVLECARAITGRRQCAHQLDRDPRVEWVERRQSPPPASGSKPITAFPGRAREPLEHVGVAMRECIAFRLDPTLELRISRKPEAVQERPRVDGYRALERARSDQLFELGHVAFDDRRLESQLTDAGNRVRGAEVPPKRVEGVIEDAAGRFLVGVGPEQGEKAFSRRASRSGARQHGEDCQSTRLGRRHRRPAPHPARPRARPTHESATRVLPRMRPMWIARRRRHPPNRSRVDAAGCCFERPMYRYHRERRVDSTVKPTRARELVASAEPVQRTSA